MKGAVKGVFTLKSIFLFLEKSTSGFLRKSEGLAAKSDITFLREWVMISIAKAAT